MARKRTRSKAATRTARTAATRGRGATTAASSRKAASAKKPAASTRAKKKPAAKQTGTSKRTAAKRPATGKPAPKRTAARKQTTRSLTSAARAVSRVVSNTVAAVAVRMPWAGSSTDAIGLLEADHRRLEDLLKQGEETTERAVQGRTGLLDTITKELKAHELIEETILYPALKAHPRATDIVLEGYEEHHVADLLVEELHALLPSDESWGAKFAVLKENIEHHIQEEEGEMFKTARAVMSREELDELGARMRAKKAEALGA